GSGSTGRPPRSCCWSCSACARTARKCCWQTRTWAARPAWRAVLDDLVKRELCKPEFLIVDGGTAEQALAEPTLYGTQAAQSALTHPSACMRRFRATTTT